MFRDKAHGGRRQGAGRKPKNPNGRRVKRIVMIDPDHDAYIKSKALPGEPYSETLNRLLAALQEPIII